jgi:hypothetical protein
VARVTGFDGSSVLRGLKDFQRRTVEHVDRAMFEGGQRRFLVADEVGLGKTLVARGLVAKTIEHLQAQGVKRIDVVYICSNQEIARQNLRRLNVLDRDDLALPSRLTLLPLHTEHLDEHAINFVSFTPATSFEPGRRTGWTRERALLYHLIHDVWDLGRRRGPKELLRANAGIDSFEWERRSIGRIDEDIARDYGRRMASSPLRDEFEELARVAGRRSLRDDERARRNTLIGELRRELAQACVRALEPDLVILDEFQRFSQLLDGESDAADLARQLFDYENERGEFARTLLLSATPYKTFSGAGDDDQHHAELSRLLRFLFGSVEQADEVERLLRDFREELIRVRGADTSRLLEVRADLEQRLSTVMVRTERLASSATRNGMLESREGTKLQLNSKDVRDYAEVARLHFLLRQRGYLSSVAAVTEFWKSSPWLAQFMDGYQFKLAIDRAVSASDDDPELASALEAVRGQLDWSAYTRYDELAPPNPRMRALLADTVNESWDLLWMPASMPYHRAGAPFDRPGVATLTKRLVFSSWNVVPRAIAGAISYEAERAAFRATDAAADNTPASRIRHDRRLLDFRIDSRVVPARNASMPVLAWLLPSATLAELTDPLDAATALGQDGLPAEAEVIDWAAARVSAELDQLAVSHDPERRGQDQRWYWAAPLLLDAAARRADSAEFWSAHTLAEAWSDGDGAAENWRHHVDEARQVFDDGLALGDRPADLAEVVALLGLSGPGNVALRTLRRETAGSNHTAQLVAAARIGWGLRKVFNGPEAIAVVSARNPDLPYWRASLLYATAGNLQATFDEWGHVVAEDCGADRDPADQVLAAMSAKMTMALGLGTTRVEVDRLDGTGREAWRSHFALRYGAFREDGSEGTTHPEAVRAAFNSPFRPFVLASTSVGQEGLDFHTYCHAIVHWNIPSNPVDLEQREGRVHRYKGHAVRRNVAAAYAPGVLASAAERPWTTIFAVAADRRDPAEDDLVPYWLYPGAATIDRYVPALPHSRDDERMERVQRQVTLYRMVFGQPRQDDLLQYLQRTIGQEAAQHLAEVVRIDLAPASEPTRTKKEPNDEER